MTAVTALGMIRGRRARRPWTAGWGLPLAVRHALVVALLGAAAGHAPKASAVEGAGWRTLLERAGVSAASVPYAGEALWVTWTEEGDAQAVTLEVRNSGSGRLTLASPSRYSLTVGQYGGSFVDHREGWLLPLPAGASPASEERLDGGGEQELDLLERKYRVAVGGQDELLDRPCTRLEISRRDDGTLRERLWLDDVTGLLLRRETFDGEDRRVRLVAYLSLDLHPADGGRPRAGAAQAGSVQRLDAGVTAVGSQRLDALRHAGWVIPSPLPGGYQLSAIYTVSSAEGQPLQLVYSDGLYAVSLFEQRGALDPESLPPGARRVAELGERTYEWPRATPGRIVWEAQGATFSLVGDAPRDELLEIARALPRPAAPGVSERLRRGFRTLWSWLPP
jgi:sigma-E factor negative regulatory protein RseB